MLTASHCVGSAERSRPRVRFGQRYPVPASQSVQTVDCVVFLGARPDTITPRCLNFSYFRNPDGSLGYGPELRVPYDLAVVVLVQRVDADNLPGGPAVLPMPIAFDSPGADPASWRGEPVHLVGPGLDQRVFLAKSVVDLDLEDTRFIMNLAGTAPRDSGSAWTWVSAAGSSQLISVFNLDPRLGSPQVRAWLEPLVASAGSKDAFIGNVYRWRRSLGHPRRGGLSGTHECAWPAHPHPTVHRRRLHFRAMTRTGRAPALTAGTSCWFAPRSSLDYPRQS